MAGKGSRQRPCNREKFNENWDRIFMAKPLKEGTWVVHKSTGDEGEIVDVLSTQYFVVWGEDGEEGFVFHDEVKEARP